MFRSPLEVFTGQKPVRPLLRALPVADYLMAKTADEIQARKLTGIDCLQDALHEMHRDVRGLISKSRQRQIQAHNSRTNVSTANFDVGDFVLVRRSVMGGHKLSFIWAGPRRVVECKSGFVYVVQDLISSKRETVHVRRLLRYRSDMDGKPVSPKLLNAAAHSSARYQVVNAIRGIRNKDGEIELHFEWDGLPDQVDWTWEPLGLAHRDVPSMVQEYLGSGGSRELKKLAHKRIRSA